MAVPFEMPVDSDHVVVPDDEFGVAEAASGYTRNNTMSPLHGAMMAAAIANDGVMMEPSIVNHLISKDGKTEYNFEPKTVGNVVDKQTAEELATMMHRTVTDGTSSRVFRHADRSLRSPTCSSRARRARSTAGIRKAVTTGSSVSPRRTARRSPWPRWSCTAAATA